MDNNEHLNSTGKSKIHTGDRKPISMYKKYKSGGKLVRLLCDDRKNTLYPVVGLCISEQGTGEEGIRAFTKFGQFTYDKDSEYDLVEVWEPRVGEWCWFYDAKDQTSAFLSKFVEISKDGKFVSDNHSKWKCCSKFTKDFPEHLNGQSI
jgi:hypothetical protein